MIKLLVESLMIDEKTAKKHGSQILAPAFENHLKENY